MRYSIFTALLTTSILSACTVGTPSMSIGLGTGINLGSHLGLGTSVNIPVRLDTSNENSHNGINVIEEKIITYFDAKGVASNAAVKNGFYRKLIQKSGNDYLVQDFYEDSGKKRTDPYTLSREQLMTFRTYPNNGSLTTYSYNGNIMQQQVFQNGKLVSSKY